jgi:Zn finger protein HypA/HybF involved in hydrogenase expression
LTPAKEEAVHELGITQGIIDRAREAAKRESAARIGRLYLVLTPAADFSPESIEMYFTMLTEGDPLFAGASLEFGVAPAGALCLACGDEFVTEAPQPMCPQCGSSQVRFDPAAPMIQLTEIDVDDADEARDEGRPGDAQK